MILLQAAIIGGMVIVAIFLILLVFGVPILTLIIKNIIRNYTNKESLNDNNSSELINNTKKPNKPFTFNTSINFLISIIILIAFFISLILLFDKCNPKYGYDN